MSIVNFDFRKSVKKEKPAHSSQFRFGIPKIDECPCLPAFKSISEQQQLRMSPGAPFPPASP